MTAQCFGKPLITPISLRSRVIAGQDENLKTHGLFILANLCRGNPVVARYLFSQTTEKERKLLVTTEMDDTRMKVRYKCSLAL